MDINDHLQNLSESVLALLKQIGLPDKVANTITDFLLILLTLAAAFLVHSVIKKLLRILLININKKRQTAFFKFLLAHKLPSFISIAMLVMVLYVLTPTAFKGHTQALAVLLPLYDISLVWLAIKLIMMFINAAADGLKDKSSFRGKPINSYLQVMSLVLYLFGAVILFSNFTGKSPLAFFTAMGAISAVLLLMFKDTIMGFVASIQVTTNDMVRIGDWITMPKYGADGDILEINLTTVKVQNFDKTITTIPTYALISDSFQNWRGMVQAGGRRIKRAINIKQSSIRFISADDLASFEKIQLISGYIQHRTRDIDKYNERTKADKSLLINGRNLTNAGLFRKYVDSYLAQHPATHKNMSIMVRQLAPTPEGLPFEIYAFANTVVWKEYEYIMADIFDHIIAAAPFFNLEIFEMEGSGDVKKITMNA